MPDSELHRYELLPERRHADRRSGDAALLPERRGRDRRRGRSLTQARAVRRIFPLIEGTAPTSVAARTRVQRWALRISDFFTLSLSVYGVGALAGQESPALAALISGVIAVLLSQALDLYDKDDLVVRRSTLEEAPQIGQLALISVLVSWLVFTDGLSRSSFLLLWAIAAVAMVTGRALARACERRMLEPERCAVIGDAAIAEQIAEKLVYSGANAIVTNVIPLFAGDTNARLADLRELVDRERIHRVVIAPTSTDAADTLELVRLAKAAGVRVSVLPRLFEVVGSAVEFESVDGMTLLGVKRFGLNATERMTKRGFDLLGSLVLVALLSPIMAIIAIAIRLDSRGPILFRQVRVGRDGGSFCIFKFRTMVPDAEQRKHQLVHLNEGAEGFFKITEDPRITRVGRFLRRTSLDELPQLFNVVRGEMSLVGPRPLVADEDSQILGLDRQRLHLTPGMTGPWQVLGSSRVPMEEMVSLDYVYVSSWSIWNDVKLLLRTGRHVLARGGR